MAIIKLCLQDESSEIIVLNKRLSLSFKIIDLSLFKNLTFFGFEHQDCNFTYFENKIIVFFDKHTIIQFDNIDIASPLKLNHCSSSGIEEEKTIRSKNCFIDFLSTYFNHKSS